MCSGLILVFAVFDKASGTMLYGPAFGSTIWTGFGGPCEQDNDGDIVAEYDKAASRWVMSQHAVPQGLRSCSVWRSLSLPPTRRGIGTGMLLLFPMIFPTTPSSESGRMHTT